MTTHKTIAEMTTEVAITFLNNNQIELSDVPELIRSVYKSFRDSTIEEEATPRPVKLVDHTRQEPRQELILPGQGFNGRRAIATTTQKPAVPLEESVTPDWVTCLEDGKKFKTMRHHLRKNYDMSPEEYRRKWGLPDNWPITAPNHSEARRKIAKGFGLGSKIR